MWMLTEYDESILDYQKINYGIYKARLRDDESLQEGV